MKQLAVGDIVKLKADGPCSSRGTLAALEPDPNAAYISRDPDYPETMNLSGPKPEIEAYVRWPDRERYESLSALEGARPGVPWFCHIERWATILVSIVRSYFHLG